MREFVLALRAIWSSWNTGEKLDFRGEFYTHTLMTPFFSPGPNPHGTPKVFLAAVGDRMTEVAGEVADGIILHPFTTEQYVREVTMPALERGFAAGGKQRAGFEVSSPIFVVTGSTAEDIDAARTAAKQQIAFYGSTPGYRGVLEQHGWGEVGDQLNQLSRKGEWVAMGDLITDDMLETFGIVAAPGDVATRLSGRFADVVDRISFYAPYRSDPELWKRVVTELKGWERLCSRAASIARSRSSVRGPDRSHSSRSARSANRSPDGRRRARAAGCRARNARRGAVGAAPRWPDRANRRDPAP